MARRFSTTTRVLTAASALALAGVLSACHPPNQQPSEMGNADNSLPTYNEPAGAAAEEGETTTEESATATTVTVTETLNPDGTITGGENDAESAAGGEAAGGEAAGAETAAPTTSPATAG